MTASATHDSARQNRLSLIWLGVVALAFVVLASWLDAALVWPWFGSEAPSWELAALNVLPFLLIVLLFCAMTRRVILSSWLGLLLAIASYAANAAKLEQLEMPLLPGDFHFLSDMGAALPVFVHYLGAGLKPTLVVVGVLVVSMALFREKAWPAMRGWVRVSVAVVSIGLGVGLVNGWTPWRSVYSADRLHFEPWSVVDSARHAGVMSNLVLYNWELAKRQELRPDRQAASDLLRANANTLRMRLAPNSSTLGMPEGIQPDIVIVQSESLFDPVRLRNAPVDTYLPNFHRLARQGLSGNMRVPTFAGGTIRTEFEVLTGLALQFFPGVQYPYFEIAEQPIPGIVRTLSRQGYRTTAIHPNSGVFWNRNQAFRQIGFDRFFDIKEFARESIVGLFTGDAALTDCVLSELDQDGPPQMIFAISMENHGPFDWRPGLDAKRLAGIKLPPGLDESDEYWLRNYLYLLEDADHELGRLADALQQRKRRTVLMFYGDHLPGLGPVYGQVGFADGRGPKDQPVPWLILDNGRKFSSSTAQPDLTSWLLPSLLLEVAGIGGDRYFATLGALRDNLPENAMASSTSLPAELRAMGQLRFRGELEPLIDSALDSTGGIRDTAVAP